MEEKMWRYWGKAGKDEGPGADYHLLVYHCLDVAAVGDVWWSRSSSLRRSFTFSGEIKEEEAKAWVLFFISLHDLGKFDVRFQLKAPHAAQKLWPKFMQAKKDRYDHGQMGYAWFCKEAESIYGLNFFQADEFDSWIRAVAGHHGSLPASPESKPPFASPEVKTHDREARNAFFRTMWKLFLDPAGILPDAVPPVCPPLLAGFCSVCDWIGSNEAEGYFSFQSEETDDLSVYYESRKEIAEKALKDIGLYQSPLLSGGMNLIFPEYSPRQVQTLVDKWPVEAGLTMIEAPTGSGKTEAALAYASRLLSEGIADSIVFALPTQATANAMLERIEKVAEKMFPDGSNVVLAHGKSRYNPKFIDIQQAAERKSLQDEGDGLVQCARWLACSRKRVFLGQIGVCTLDQVLLSVLPVRHQFVRAFGIRKSILIVDEIHAYDQYMYGLLNRVLEGQKQAGGSAILLSATLPGYQREQLAAAWDAVLPEDDSKEYPLVTWVDDSGKTRLYSLTEKEMPPERKVSFTLWQSPELRPVPDQINEICEAAKKGAMVAIVCNLVADAQNIADELNRLMKDESVPVDIFHARYRFQDRLKREQKILSLYGKEAERGKGRILVATQVIEQSLDLDFDWMISQLCPVDLLFQRVGRLHRHEREKRPAYFENPRCAVLLPCEPDYGLHKVIYGNTRVLWRTEQMLRNENEVCFPEAYRSWIEKVYQEEAWENEAEQIVREFEKFQEDQIGKQFAAAQIAGADAVPLSDTDGNAARLTRDGENSLHVFPVLEEKGQKCTLEGEKIFNPKDWRYPEQMNRNIVSVPYGWKKILPPADENSLHYLPMRRIESEKWESKNAEAVFHYSSYKGLERLEK